MGSKPKAPGETGLERANAEIALKRYGHYMQNYRPFEDKAFADVTSKNSMDKIERQAGGAINADSAQIMNQRGSGPVRGEIFDPQAAKGMAGAQAQASQLGRKLKMGGLQAINAIGLGQANEAQLGIGHLAGDAVRQNIQASENAYNRRAANTSAIMTVAGGAARGMESPRAQGVQQPLHAQRPPLWMGASDNTTGLD